MRKTLAVALLLLVSCAATKRRAVEPRAPWHHEWARGAVFYEIFVRSFADSDGDGVGDFNGMTAKLDYLDSLGIDGIWLMPMFESTSYHGYDTTDYDNVERDYGTNADFQRFLDEAHKRDIRVIVDLVLNHTSVEHPWFVESASSPSSPRRDWYVWRATDPGWKQPWGGYDPSWHFRNGAYYYGAFWSGMPDLNYDNAAAKAEMFRITRSWLERGVSGYRLDATRYLVETGPGEAGQADTAGTRRVLAELSAEVRKVRPDSVLVAENTVDTAKLATYYDSMPMNFNFPLAAAIVEGVKNGSATGIVHVLRDVLRLYPRGAIDAPFLTNHDQTRIATVLGNDDGKLRSAAAILLTLPGMPFLYYGEEVGLDNGPGSNDEAKRTPMPWSAAGGFTTGTPWHAYAPGVAADNVASQANDPASLLSHYRGWIAARKATGALSKGTIAPLEAPVSVLAFVRESGDERVLVVHNLGRSPSEVALPVDAAGFENIHGNVPAPNGSRGAWRVSVPAYGSAAWRLR
ncbi:MAG TPA: alpha-amylase family glycosyl hydrolase [Thermoanaerobaculia bacterium]|nr:alpha-amylase family glycosyl hydrolase [Thermoanaerobaculia bacterium]